MGATSLRSGGPPRPWAAPVWPVGGSLTGVDGEGALRTSLGFSWGRSRIAGHRGELWSFAVRAGTLVAEDKRTALEEEGR